MKLVWLVSIAGALAIFTVLAISADSKADRPTTAATDRVAKGESAMNGDRDFFEQATIYEAGTEGYHTFRIPALAVCNSGTVLAFCEARKESKSDYGDVDLVVRRSFDLGQSWEPMQVIWDDGKNTIGNPCPVVDRSTGTIWLPFCWNNDRVFVTKSTDDGASWSTPREITADVKPKEWGAYFTGPGHGIQLSTGRLLIPCVHGAGQEPPYGPFTSHVIYSDDHGRSWEVGGVLKEGTTECQVVETSDGAIYLNARTHPPTGTRAYAWSKDGGITWSEAKQDSSLNDPGCQGTVIRFTDSEHHDRNRILFSNAAGPEAERLPATKGPRLRLTVRLSYDECRSWTEGRVLHDGPSSYSDLCILPDMTIGCLYEHGEKGAPQDWPWDANKYKRIKFARFSLSWLTEGADQLR